MTQSFASRIRKILTRKKDVKSIESDHFSTVNPLHEQKSQDQTIQKFDDTLTSLDVTHGNIESDIGKIEADTTPAPSQHKTTIIQEDQSHIHKIEHVQNNIHKETAKIIAQEGHASQTQEITTKMQKKLTRLTKLASPKTTRAKRISKKDTQSFSR